MLVRTNITVRFTGKEDINMLEIKTLFEAFPTSNSRFKIERFEVVGDVTDDVEKNCWDVHGQDDTEESSAKHGGNWKYKN